MDGYDYYLGTSSKRYDSPPKFYSSDGLVQAGCQFSSLYAVSEETSRRVTQAGTTAGYRGVVWSPRLWIDCDTEESTRGAISRLKELGYAFDVWDTGGDRGGHISVLRDCRPSHVLPAQDKAWVAASLDRVDTGIYGHLHLFRLPGAVHDRTGKPKRLIESHLGLTLKYPPWVESVQPKSIHGIGSGETPKGIFRSWDVISNLTPDGGSRHHQLVRLAIAVRKSGGTSYEASYLCGELNKAFDEPKGLDEVGKITEWVYKQ